MEQSNSIVIFHKLLFGSEANSKNEYTVIRYDTDQTIKVEKKVVEIIQLLLKKKSIADVAKITNTKDEIVKAMVEDLSDLGFVRAIDGQEIEDNHEKIAPVIKDPSKLHLNWIFSKFFFLFLLGYIFAGFVLGFFALGRFPSYKDYFWSKDLLLVAIVQFVFNMLLLFWHEFGHLITTYAVGGLARFRFDHRFGFVVAETISYHIGVLKKRLRYLVYISGIIADLFLIATLLIILFFANLNHFATGVIQGLILVITLITMRKISWQFNIFLETDVYNFIADFLDEENLRVNAKKKIALKIRDFRNPWFRPVRKLLLQFLVDREVREFAEDVENMSESRKKQITIYIFVLLGGFLIILWQYLFYIIPREFTFLTFSLDQMGSALRIGSPWLFIKGLLVILIVGSQYMLLTKIIISKREPQP